MFSNSIWAINSAEEFEREALELFRFQAHKCAPYGEYLRLIECEVEAVDTLSKIPFLPIELFKECDIYCGESSPEVVFTSSNTGGTVASRHPMADLSIYESAFLKGFELFYGDIRKWSIYGLLPSYLEREGSSLIYMVDYLIRHAGGGGFYLRDHEKLVQDISTDPNPKILLGVSYALWDLAEGLAPKLDNTIVMETGGMKGHREELPKDEFHHILCKAFGVDRIHSEYGMAELTSQAYSRGDNRFFTPPWMRVIGRDINDPFATVADGQRGGVNIIDLASRYSCGFIQTQDVGICFNDGSFTIEGRIERSDIRGCNLLVQ